MTRLDQCDLRQVTCYALGAGQPLLNQLVANLVQKLAKVKWVSEALSIEN